MLEKIISEIERQGFSYTENLLSSADLILINNFFDENKGVFKPAKVGPSSAKRRDDMIRGDYTFWLDPLDPIHEFTKQITFLNELQTTLNARFFLGLKQFECHLAFYPAGTFYKTHSDRFEANSSRSISFVFYLNKEWTKKDGGELVIYDKNHQQLETIYPLPGSFICFLSEDFPHEVRQSLKERRSLTGWMHTKLIY